MNRQFLKQIAKILVETAKKGKGSCITYGDLSHKLNNYISPRNLGNPLGELSDLAMEHEFPRISAIVVNQDTGLPGDGYFRYFAGGIPESQWETFWQKDIEAIYNCPSWDDFIELI